MIKNIFLLLISFCITALSFTELTQSHEVRDDFDKHSEVLYLPSGEGLQVLSFGYRNFLSDVLWMKTISYFGKHYRSDRDYRWLAHMCNLVSDLDVRAEHVFDFCGTMLAWEAELPEESIALYTKAIKANPERWRPYYLRGFVYMYFLENAEMAKQDFLTGASKPEAPAFLKRLAAKKMSLSDPVSALSFLSDAIRRSTDPVEREVLKGKFLAIKRKLQQGEKL